MFGICFTLWMCFFTANKSVNFISRFRKPTAEWVAKLHCVIFTHGWAVCTCGCTHTNFDHCGSWDLQRFEFWWLGLAIFYTAWKMHLLTADCVSDFWRLHLQTPTGALPWSDPTAWHTSSNPLWLCAHATSKLWLSHWILTPRKWITAGCFMTDYIMTVL